MNLNRIHQIAVYARDLDEAISFYRDTLGAKYVTKFDPPGLVFFDFSGVRVLLEKDGPKARIYLRVDYIDSAHAELVSKGVKFLSEPHLIFKDETGMFGEAVKKSGWRSFLIRQEISLPSRHANSSALRNDPRSNTKYHEMDHLRVYSCKFVDRCFSPAEFQFGTV